MNGYGLTIAALVVIGGGPFMFAEAGEAMIILCPVANQALDPSTEEELFGNGQWRGYSPVSTYL